MHPAGREVDLQTVNDGPEERILRTGMPPRINFRHADVCDWAAAATNRWVIRNALRRQPADQAAAIFDRP